MSRAETMPISQDLPIVAVQWAARNTVTVGGGGAGTGKVVFDTFTVTKSSTRRRRALLELMFGGTQLPQVRIDVTVRRGVTASYELSTS